MKRVYILLLAMLLLLTGCGGKTKAKDITVKKISCPYEIDHKKKVVELTLRDGENNGIRWDIEVIPEDICEVTQVNSGKGNTAVYRIAGTEPGVAVLTFSALNEDEIVVFDLVLGIKVDSDKKVVVSTSEHRERKAMSVEDDGLTYNWNVDLNGILHFSFVNEEDDWFVLGDGEGVCTLSDTMATPSGCIFSAQAIKRGKTTVWLKGENTQRKILVALEVDNEGNVKVVSVQEQ